MKAFTLVLCILAFVAFLGLSGCGVKEVISTVSAVKNVATGGGTATLPASPSTTSQRTTSTQTTQVSGGSFNWGDIPLYPGANQLQKASFVAPPTAGDSEYAKVEWRYFETGDEIEKVAEFYKKQMPDRGWEEKGWIEVLQMNTGTYTKNDENDVAMVWLSSQEGKTIIAIWRGIKR